MYPRQLGLCAPTAGILNVTQQQKEKMTKEQSQNLDKILSLLMENKDAEIESRLISKKLDIELDDVVYFIQILDDDRFIKNRDAFTSDGDYYNIKINPLGINFRKEGGYSKEFKTLSKKEKQETFDKKLTRTKTTTDIIKNSIFIITSIFSFFYFLVDIFGAIFFSFDFTKFLLRLINLN